MKKKLTTIGYVSLGLAITVLCPPFAIYALCKAQKEREEMWARRQEQFKNILVERWG